MSHPLGYCAAVNKLLCQPWSCALMSSLSVPLNKPRLGSYHAPPVNAGLATPPPFVVPHLETGPTQLGLDIYSIVILLWKVVYLLTHHPHSYNLGTFSFLVCALPVFLTLLCCLGKLLCCSDGWWTNWVAAASCSPTCWTQGVVGHPCVFNYQFSMAEYWH